MVTRNHKQALLDKCFSHCQSAFHFAQTAQQETPFNDIAYTYGEVLLPTLFRLINHCEPTSEDSFYDFGSGNGKAVIAAALTHSFKKAVGFEAIPSLMTLSQEKLQLLRHSLGKSAFLTPEICFHQQDYSSVQIESRGIIFLNATSLFGETLANTYQQLNTLPKGSRLILSSKELPENMSRFHCIHAKQYPMSWGYSMVRVYRVE